MGPAVNTQYHYSVGPSLVLPVPAVHAEHGYVLHPGLPRRHGKAAVKVRDLQAHEHIEEQPHGPYDQQEQCPGYDRPGPYPALRPGRGDSPSSSGLLYRRFFRPPYRCPVHLAAGLGGVAGDVLKLLSVLIVIIVVQGLPPERGLFPVPGRAVPARGPVISLSHLPIPY